MNQFELISKSYDCLSSFVKDSFCLGCLVRFIFCSGSNTVGVDLGKVLKQYICKIEESEKGRKGDEQ